MDHLMLAWPCMPGRLTIILTGTTRAVDGTTTISPPAPYIYRTLALDGYDQERCLVYL
jgi:hypothetical protein